MPQLSLAILEARPVSGGTWDLFRYPGIRSDSDMHTLGYRFKPWTEAKSIADGPSILAYLRETAAEYGILASMIALVLMASKPIEANSSAAQAAAISRPGLGVFLPPMES